MSDKYKYEIWSSLGINSSDWDKIRMLVCHAFGVSIVKDLIEEDIPKANAFVIKMIDLLFEQNDKILTDETL